MVLSRAELARVAGGRGSVVCAGGNPDNDVDGNTYAVYNGSGAPGIGIGRKKGPA